MAIRDVRVDLDLKQNELLNFAIHNTERASITNPVDGQTVHEADGKVYVYHLINESTGEGTWVEQASKDYVDAQVAELGDDKLDKITDANKVYGTDENGEQVSYDVDSFGKVDDVTVGGTSVVSNKVAALGTMAGEDKNDYVVTEIDNGANGKAYVWNETSGGGVRYEKGSNKVFVGVNGGNEGGEFVSIYAKDGVDADTKRIIVKSDGAYYLKNNGIATTANDEIATKADVLAKDSLPERTAQTAGQFLTNDGADASWADLPEYTIVKDAQAEEGYAHTYHLTKDGVNIGASINIPKDIVVESGSVETCTQDDVPVQGYKVGDKYIDLVLANSGGSHLYILVNDLIDVYTGSTYIDITDNTISLKYADLKTQLATDLQDTFYTESEVDTLLDGKADNATTLAGYGITDAYTKTEVDNLISAKKQVELSPALTASGNQFTWTFNNTVGEDASVTIREVNGSNNDVIANVTVTASTITIKMNQTSDLQTISAGQFKAIVLG